MLLWLSLLSLGMGLIVSGSLLKAYVFGGVLVILGGALAAVGAIVLLFHLPLYP